MISQRVRLSAGRITEYPHEKNMSMNEVSSKHNVLQEEDRGIGKCMINRILWPVMNQMNDGLNLT